MVRVVSGAPVLVGHHEPEVVVMSSEQYEAPMGSAERREAVVEALASVRAEGLEPSPDALKILEKIATGALGEEQGIEALRQRYQR